VTFGQKDDFLISNACPKSRLYGLWKIGWFKNPLSSQTEKLMAGTKFSDYLGLNHYKKAKKFKNFIHFHFTYRPQSFGS